MSRSVSGLQKSTSTDGYKKAQQDEKVPSKLADVAFSWV